MKHTHADKLERWLGADKVKALSEQFRDFYWPVAVHGVPGNVRVMPGGDFTGEIMAGEFLTAHDGAAAVLKKIRHQAELKVRKHKALGTLIDMIRAEDAGLASVGAFASVDAVIAAYSEGKGQILTFTKTGTNANAAGMGSDFWMASGTPAAGSAGAAAPGGTAPTASTTGALRFRNMGVANSGKYLNWTAKSDFAGSLLLYDRIFAVAKTMNSTATEAVTGVPTRYQNTVAGANDYIGGNFCVPVSTNNIAATAHNWTVCTYTDQGGAAGTFLSVAGVASTFSTIIDLAVGNWFLNLAAGDNGVGALTQMQCSALVATGAINFVIGHPIAVNACPIANIASVDDGLYTALTLTPILDNACLSFMDLPRPATGGPTYSGIVRTVSE